MSLTGLLFASVGTGGYFFWPKTYTATGSFFVSRDVEKTSNEYFTFEGFYSQQSALSFTDTVIGLLESVDVRKESLLLLNITPDEAALRKLNRTIKIKKAAPQLITLKVAGKTKTEAREVWTALSEIALKTVTDLRENGDRSLHLTLLQKVPVVQEAYRNILLNFSTGFLFGILTAAISIFAKDYFSKEATT